jgi:serine/threonine protein phosphatase PrpC
VVKLDASALAHPGRVRKINQDTAYQKVFDGMEHDPTGLFIVADGVGGRLAGEVASYWAVETVKISLADLIDHQDPRATNRFDRETLVTLYSAAAQGFDPGNLKDRVLTAVAQANAVVREYARQKPAEARDAGSTLSMVLVSGLQGFVANVGDSRTYLLRDGKLHQVTKDHSVVQRLIDVGQAQPQELYTHPQRHLIYRSLGAADTVKVDFFALNLAPGDYLLLCTDGLWEMVQDPARMYRIVRESPTVSDACRRLVAAANDAGGLDNIGVVVVQVCE